MPAPAANDPNGTDAKLQSLFGKLDALLQSDQRSLKKSLRLIESILALAPGDNDALKCKAVILIEHEEFNQALDVLKSNPELAKQLIFEEAYCHYRLGKLEQALAAVQRVPDEQRLGRLQLEAQLHYRLGDNKQAIRVYSELFQVHKVESLELRTNVIAAYVCGGKADKVLEITRSMQISAADSSDIGFNMACALLQLGSFDEAEEQLQLALRAGQEALLEEEVAEEDAEEELAPLTAQLAYAHSHTGKREEAAAAYQRLEALENLDASTAAVLANNLAAASYAHSQLLAAPKKAAAEALKRLEPLLEGRPGSSARLTGQLEVRLMDSQKQAILGNCALMLLAAQKADAAASVFAALRQRFPYYARLPLIHSALLAHTGKVEEADAALRGAEQQLGLPAVLMRAQLLLASGDRAAALQLLQGLPRGSLRHQPAVVATVTQLQTQEGDAAGALATLQAALDWWSNRMADSSGEENPEAWLWQQLVRAQLAAGNTAEARRQYAKLAQLNADSAERAESLAALAVAHGLSHESGLEELATLPSIQSFDASALSKLENSAAAAVTVKRPPREEAAPLAQETAAAAAVATTEKQKKKKKKRKPRYPKGYDSENPPPPPDPERWLPKWQRSDFKKQKLSSRQRKAKEAMKGSQGQGRVDESLDISQKAIPDVAAAGAKAPAGKAASRSGGGGRRKGRR